MNLISKGHLYLTLQTIKKLLSFKIDKSDIITNEGTMDILFELGAIEPITTSNGSILTSKTGEIYTL